MAGVRPERRMQDAKFFEQLLGLREPWSVKNVSLDLAGQKVVVEVAVKAHTKWVEEGERCPV